MRDSLRTKLPDECCNCGAKEDLHVHHIVPLALGGTNRISNCAVICATCHRKVHGLSDESINHGELVLAGKKRTKNAGKWSSGLIPFGYRAGRDKGVVEVNDDEAEVVRLIYKWRFVHKLKLTEIESALNFMSITGRYDGSKWSSSTLNQILKRFDVYLGNAHNNVVFPQVLPDEYGIAVINYNETHQGKRIRRSRNVIYGKALEQSGAFSIAQ
jgi:hypothetical protein